MQAETYMAGNFELIIILTCHEVQRLTEERASGCVFHTDITFHAGGNLHGREFWAYHHTDLPQSPATHRRASKRAGLPPRHCFPCRWEPVWQWTVSSLSHWLSTKSSDSPKSEQAGGSSSQTLLSMQVGTCLAVNCELIASRWLNTKSLIVTLT